MNKFEQIAKLAEAAQLIQEVQPHTTPLVAADLENIISTIADIADEIEGV